MALRSMTPQDAERLIADLYDDAQSLIVQLWEDYDYINRCRDRHRYDKKELELALAQTGTAQALLSSIHHQIDYLVARFTLPVTHRQQQEQPAQATVRPPQPLQQQPFQQPLRRAM